MTLDKILKNFNKQLVQLDKYIQDEEGQKQTGEHMIASGKEKVQQADNNISRATRIKGKIQEIVQ